MPLKDFQELLKEKPELLKEVEQVFEKAEAVAKVQTANQEISRERDDLRTKLASAGTEKAAIESAKKDLETKLAEAQKGTPDQAVLNGLNEKIAALTKVVEDEKAEKAKAVQEKRESDLQGSLISAAGKAINPKQVVALMKAEGLAGLSEKGEPFFIKRNAEGQPVALKAEEAVDSFLTSNAHLMKSSGNGGSGGNANPTAPTVTGLLANPEAAL